MLITELNNLIPVVGDSSNVNFDSYEGTSYLFNAFASQMLPQTNNTSLMKSIGPDVLARGSLTEDEKLWLRTASVKSRMNALQTSMDTFFWANPKYEERLKKPTEQPQKRFNRMPKRSMSSRRACRPIWDVSKYSFMHLYKTI